MAAELLASSNTDSPWPEISHGPGISKRAALRSAASPSTPTAQGGHVGRPGKLVNDENKEILARTRQQRAEHGVIDASWTRVMMAEVTDD
jgi:hypothetical protein